jgi:hypothetical protein
MLLRYRSRQHRVRPPSDWNVKSSEDVTLRKGWQTSAASQAGAARWHTAAPSQARTSRCLRPYSLLANYSISSALTFGAWRRRFKIGYPAAIGRAILDLAVAAVLLLLHVRPLR